MASSLNPSRSSRRPASTTVPRPKPSTTPVSTHNPSPSRLPLKPSTRPSSVAPPSASTTRPVSNLARVAPKPAKPSCPSRPLSQPVLRPPAARPAFSALQQHYSPARPGTKPTAPSYSGHKSGELLRVCLLHRDAGPVGAAWHGSAKEKLRGRFDAVCAEDEALRRRERAVQEERDLSALRSWGGSRLEERVQVVDDVVMGVWGMSEPGGRYAALVSSFEGWVEGVRGVERARGGGVGEGAVFVDELDGAWKEEREGFVRRLEAWRRRLAGVDDGDLDASDVRASSLGRMLTGTRELLDGMVAELRAMGEMEELARAREDAWIESMVSAEMDVGDTPGRDGPVWRVV